LKGLPENLPEHLPANLPENCPACRVANRQKDCPWAQIYRSRPVAPTGGVQVAGFFLQHHLREETRWISAAFGKVRQFREKKFKKVLAIPSGPQ